MKQDMEVYSGLGSELSESGLELRLTSNLDNPSDWLVEAVGGRNSAAGIRVTPTKAMGFVAFFSCVRNIAEDIAKIPIEVIRRTGERREIVRDHAVTRLLNFAPNSEMTAFDFRRTILMHSLAFQGGFAQIIRDLAGNPIELWPMDPTRIEVRRVSQFASNDFNLFRDEPDEAIVYIYHTDIGTFAFPQEGVLHLHGLSFNGIAASAITAVAKDALGAALATQEQNSGFFANGAMSAGVLQVPNTLSDPALKHLRDSFAARHSGSRNAYKPIILEEGATYNQTSIDPDKAQMIESMDWHVRNVARLFRMPPHKIQDLGEATFSNIESQAREYVGDTLEPHATNWEQVIWWKLFRHPREDDLEIRHNFRALLRADAQAQAEWYSKMFNIGVFSIDDIRAFEDMNPIPEGGDQYFRPVNLSPVNQEPEEIAPQPVTPMIPDPNQEPEPEEDNREQIIRAFQPVLEQAIGRVLRIEADKTKRGKGWVEGKHIGQTIAETEWGRFLSELVTRELRPVVDAMTQSLPPTRVPSGFCISNRDHMHRSMDEIEKHGLDKALEYWRGDRAKDESEKIIQSILEAIKCKPNDA